MLFVFVIEKVTQYILKSFTDLLLKYYNVWILVYEKVDLFVKYIFGSFYLICLFQVHAHAHRLALRSDQRGGGRPAQDREDQRGVRHGGRAQHGGGHRRWGIDLYVKFEALAFTVGCSHH
jgi:hypothetical protein